MASAKLVKVHHSHHHHHHHISPPKHHKISSRKRSSSPVQNTCPSPPAYLRNQQSPAMTLDYSLPRGRDLEAGSPPRNSIEPGLQSQKDNVFYPHNFGKNREIEPRPEEPDEYDSCRDDPDASPTYHSGEDRDPQAETPTKKNKRKLSSPRRRADISDDEAAVKKNSKKKKLILFPPASPTGEDEDSGIDSYKSVEDTFLDVVSGAERTTFAESPSLERISARALEKSNPGPNSQNIPLSKLSSADVPLSSPTPLPPTPMSLSSDQLSAKSSKSKHRRKPSSKSHNSEQPATFSSSQNSANLDTQSGEDGNKKSPPPPHDTPVVSGLPPGFLHPMLATAGVPPGAALGFVPGLYFGTPHFGHPSLHPTLSILPPHLQQAYIAAAAAAAAQASALTPTPVASSPSVSHPSSPALPSSQALNSEATPSPLPSSLLSSKICPGFAPKAETTVSESLLKQPAVNAVVNLPPKASAHSSKLKRQKRQSMSSASSSSPQPQQLKHLTASAEPSTSSFPSYNVLHPSSCASSSSSSNINHHVSVHRKEPYSAPSTSASAMDENDSSSSRPQSPEDLSMPGVSGGSRMSRKHRKNYKNMTRERRVEANARERTRVHTISAAFEALRRAVPSYSHNQKLSKLAILRIACSYIMSLARLGDMDYTSVSEHIGHPLNFAECVEMTTNTIQTEGRARRRH
ncbi:hypothetical protein PoB_004874700 [Plakobranchus ocellatus]|uniref:BHLH domain-containing protein n=1 Tax=Plakobranchus ocellatus TaxID=259542 RepID=A0AAV4BSC8_9GAST|nr:hypothetical protein PoB_004874700 [Plakobranchus ocellatus]